MPRMGKRQELSDAFVGLRVPTRLLRRADALGPKIGTDPMMRVTRSTVLRMALARGLDALEAEYK